MKNVRVTSTVFFYLTRIVAVLYLCITMHAAISILTEWSYITKDSGNSFAVCYPFTQIPFLVGENNWAYKLFSFALPLGLYGIFFWLVSTIFKVFKQPKLFTQYGVKQLKWFYLANIIVPPIAIFLASVFVGEIENGFKLLVIMHFFLGMFAYFLSAIFKQGLHLQNENDLYI